MVHIVYGLPQYGRQRQKAIEERLFSLFNLSWIDTLRKNKRIIWETFFGVSNTILYWVLVHKLGLRKPLERSTTIIN